MTKKRVNVPELKALLAEVNRRYLKHGNIPLDAKRAFTFPDPKIRQVVFLEFEPHRRADRSSLEKDFSSPSTGWVYKETHVFDLPKDAKNFLVKQINELQIPVEGYTKPPRPVRKS